MGETTKYVECVNCKKIYDCERTYLGGCADGEKWDDKEEKENENE